MATKNAHFENEIQLNSEISELQEVQSSNFELQTFWDSKEESRENRERIHIEPPLSSA